jgi:hypothetical protein
MKAPKVKQLGATRISGRGTAESRALTMRGEGVAVLVSSFPPIRFAYGWGTRLGQRLGDYLQGFIALFAK